MWVKRKKRKKKERKRVTMFSKKIWRKKRHLNLRMNPRVSCDCDFFRVGGGGGGILKLEEEKNVYTCTVCRCPLRVSTLAVFFLHFCSGPASILTEKHAGVISWRKVEGATETWTWKTNHLQPVWDAEKLCIEVINGKLFSGCASLCVYDQEAPSRDILKI